MNASVDECLDAEEMSGIFFLGGGGGWGGGGVISIMLVGGRANVGISIMLLGGHDDVNIERWQGRGGEGGGKRNTLRGI